MRAVCPRKLEAAIGEVAKVRPTGVSMHVVEVPMEVYFDQSLLGQAEDPEALSKLLDAPQLELVVCTRVDETDTNLDELLELSEWSGQRLDLYTFDGWIEEAGQRVAATLERLPKQATEVATMISHKSPIELVDDLLVVPKEILGELSQVKEHLGEELAGVIDELSALALGAESVVVLAIRDKDFVRVADALRFEWSLLLNGLLGFLIPETEVQLETFEAGISLSGSELYELNLEALAARYPMIVSQVRAAWEGRDQDRYQIDEGPAGVRAPRVNNQRMWSMISPRADAQRIATGHIGDSNHYRWDCAGTWGLSGPIAFEILSDEMKDRPQIFVRPNLEAFAAELHCSDWRELLAAEHTGVCFSVDEFRWTLRSCFVHKDRIRRLSSPNLLAVDPGLYTELHEQSGHTELSLNMESHTGLSRGRHWVANSLENTAVLLPEPDARKLRGMGEGLPGLLVAPGPSLKKNIHLISEFAKKGVVVGVSHVLGKLQKMGVDPELVVAIEANDISSHFDDTEPERTSLFIHESTHPKVVGQPVAQRWVVHDSEIGRRLKNDDNLKSIDMVASSCTHVAMWALKELGCDPIVFVGLDLALEDGKQYSEGCEGWTPTQQTLEVDGYYGDKVQTLSQYNVFRDQFELCLTHRLFKGRQYINSTEGGAKINGADQYSLAEVLEQLAERPDKERSGPFIAPPEHLPTIDWSQAADSLDASAQELGEAERSARRGLESAKDAMKCFKAGDEPGIHRRGRAASKRARRANEVLTKDHILNGRWMAEQNKRSQRLERERTYLEDDPNALMRHNLTHYQQLLASIEEAAQTLKPLYENAAKRIRERHHV